MAEATNTHDYWQLSRLARWHVESEAMNEHWQLWWPRRVNCRCHASGGWARQHRAMVSFPTARHGEVMNMVNAKYGSVPGLKRILT